MANELAQEILKHVENLTAAEQLAMLDELRRRAASAAAPTNPRSILELEGLGVEVWKNLDAQEYVRSERASWNG
ncbi:MAG: hypothetical protein AB7O59_17150 [Pirellulales bacterium]